MADSKALHVIVDFHPYSEIILGPNDAYDLGLLALTKDVKILVEGEVIEGKIIIDNKCKDSTVKLNKRLHQKAGSPPSVKLTINGDTLILHKA